MKCAHSFRIATAACGSARDAGLSRLSESNIRAVLEPRWIRTASSQPSPSLVTAPCGRRPRRGSRAALGTSERTFTERDGLPGRIVDRAARRQAGHAMGRDDARRGAAGRAAIRPARDARWSGLEWVSDSLDHLAEQRRAVALRTGARPLPMERRASWTASAMRSASAKPTSCMPTAPTASGSASGSGGLAVYDRGQRLDLRRRAWASARLGERHLRRPVGRAVGGNGTELARVDGQRIRTFGSNGFPQTGVVSMVEDGAGDFWIGLGPSLMRIDPREFELAAADPHHQLRYRLYGAEDGLPGTRRAGPACRARREPPADELLFVTSVGLAVVDPRRLRDRPPPTLIRVEQRVGGWPSG